CGVGGETDPQVRPAWRDAVWEENPVVASPFHDQALPPEREPLDDHVDISPGVRQPAVGIGRQVRILGEDPLRAHVLLHLDQEAPFTYVHTERIKGLHLVELRRRDIALAKRRYTEVDDGLVKRRPAEATRGLHRDRRVLPR